MNPALTLSQSFPIKWTGGSEQQPAKTFDLTELQGADQTLEILEEHVEKAVIYTTVQIKSAYHNQPVGSFNHSSWVPKDPSAKPMLALEPSEWSTAAKELIKGTTFNVPKYNQSGRSRWLQLVVNNVDDKGHPFHVVCTPTVSLPCDYCANSLAWFQLFCFREWQEGLWAAP